MKNSRLKSFLQWAISHPYAARPRWWVRAFVTPFMTNRGRGTIIRSSVRMDIFPWHKLTIGRKTVIESRSTLNNGMGNISIGNQTRIGINNTLIAPITIGDNVHLAQNIVISAINHNFADPLKRIDQQGVTTQEVIIENDVWIGANAVITAGVRVGEHSVVAAGSIVTHDVPPRTIVAGVPAKVIRNI